MYKTISNCRVCGSQTLTNVMSLGIQTLTGVFPKNTDEAISSGPVDLVKCSGLASCGLVQLKQSYDISEMYGDNYGYRSSLNSAMVAHLRSKVQKIQNLDVLKKGDLIIDIGSNDCTTLKCYTKNSFQLVGVDPTGGKFKSYYPPEIKLVTDFFSLKSLRQANINSYAKVVTSFSMFYDLEDPIKFAKDVEEALAEDGLWIFEQSYLPFMLQKNSFDTICHEHLEFYTLKQIFWILEKAKLKVVDVEFNNVNGGSFSVTAAKVNSSYKINLERISKIIEDENQLAIDSIQPFKEFNERVGFQKSKLIDFLVTAKNEGKVVCGIGASTKGNVLLQYFGINSDLISCIGEVNSEKFGRYTPGTLIPLVSEDEMLSLNPDYILVLPWHFRDFFVSLDKLKGQKLVFPLPSFEIVQV